jgi:hypothetical protein
MPTRTPRQRLIATVPNPRRPRAVRVVGGGELLDLFAVFPELPRPPRPAERAALAASLFRFLGRP